MKADERAKQGWEARTQELMSAVWKHAERAGAAQYPHASALFRECYTALETLRRDLRGTEDAYLACAARGDKDRERIAALEQQVAELREDAERYRWLRNWIPASTVQHFSKIKGHAPDESESQKVDSAIDAVRSR